MPADIELVRFGEDRPRQTERWDDVPKPKKTNRRLHRLAVDVHPAGERVCKMQRERSAATEPDHVNDAILGAVPFPVRGKRLHHLVHAITSARTEYSADNSSRL